MVQEHDSITSTYKKADEKVFHVINEEAKDIPTKLDIEDRMECMTKQQAFITLKDHKENFKSKPTCKLINKAKNEMGLVSKKILEKINTNIRSITSLNQWKNTSSLINCFENIPEKHQHTFVIFDIEIFYPSISEDLLKKSINWAEQHTKISKQDMEIIMHSRKSLLFDKNAAWVKKGDDNLFDVTKGVTMEQKSASWSDFTSFTI